MLTNKFLGLRCCNGPTVLSCSSYNAALPAYDATPRLRPFRRQKGCTADIGREGNKAAGMIGDDPGDQPHRVCVSAKET